jgi:hypothetical protein
MPSHIRPLSIVAVVALLFASPAYSWGNKGDEIVAAIAETELSETARTRIKELLPQDTPYPIPPHGRAKQVVRFPIWSPTTSSTSERR